MTKRTPYIVRQGDYLTRLASQTGYDEDELWDHPANDPLREQGRTGNVLQPGDVLHIPDAPPRSHSVSLGTTNRYRATIPRVPLRLVFKMDGQPRAGQKYQVLDVGEVIDGVADGDGAISIEVPVHLPSVRVVFLDPYAVYQVNVGHVDPAEESSGVSGRLRQLGYLPHDAAPGDVSDERLRAAVASFQKDQGIDATGDLDGDTRTALRKAFGS